MRALSLPECNDKHSKIQSLTGTVQPRDCHRVPTPPIPLLVATAGKNHLYEEITPLLPTGIGERLPNHITFKTSNALAPMLTPPINERAELTQGALQLILYSEGSVFLPVSFFSRRKKVPFGSWYQHTSDLLFLSACKVELGLVFL